MQGAKGRGWKLRVAGKQVGICLAGKMLPSLIPQPPASKTARHNEHNKQTSCRSCPSHRAQDLSLGLLAAAPGFSSGSSALCSSMDRTEAPLALLCAHNRATIPQPGARTSLMGNCRVCLLSLPVLSSQHNPSTQHGSLQNRISFWLMQCFKARMICKGNCWGIFATTHPVQGPQLSWALGTSPGSSGYGFIRSTRQHNRASGLVLSSASSD